jgi:predicted Holliday junction resolvase-like endonuclease
MEYILVVLSLIIIALIYAVWNLIRKYESLEDEMEFSEKYINLAYDSMKKAYDRMKKIDRLGSFEADDESGFIFNEIKTAMEELNEVYELDATKEKE